MNQTETDNPAFDSSPRHSRLLARGSLADTYLLSTLVDGFHPALFVVAFFVLLGVLLGLYQVYREPPLYDASTEILLQPVEATQLTLVYSGSAKKSVVSLPTEAQILVSDTVLGRVAMDLDLANDSRFSPFARTGYRYDAKQPAVRGAMIAKLRDGLSVRYDSLKSDKHSGSTDASGLSERARRSSQGSGPRLMHLTFTASNPEIAAAILRSEIKMYVDRNYELRHDAIIRVSAQLSASMDDFRRRVASEQLALLTLQQRSGLVGTAGGRNPDQAELLQLNQVNTLAKAQAKATEAANEIMMPNGLASSAPNLPYAPEDVQRLQYAIHLVDLQLVEFEATLGPAHPSVLELRARKAQLERELSVVQVRIANQLAADLQLVRSQANLLGSEIETKARQVRAEQVASVDATALQVQLDRDSELYYVLVNNVRTAEIDAGYGSIAVSVLKEPDVPNRPRRKEYATRTLFYSISGFSLGLLLASLVVFRANGSPSANGQTERLLCMRCLAEIPWTPQAPRADSSRPLVLSNPLSDFAHAISGFRDVLLLSPASSLIKLLVFTGVSRGQGTTTVALNMAIALAKRGARVLLIDVDGHNPTIHKRLRLGRSAGLGEVLRDEVGIEEAVLPCPGVAGLDVLSSELLLADSPVDPERTRLLLKQAQESYEFVVVDAPSIQRLHEVEGIVGMADLVVLVLRQGESSRRQMAQSGIAIRNSGVRLSGFVRIGRQL